MRIFCKCGSRTSHLAKIWFKILITLCVIYSVVAIGKAIAPAFSQEEGIEVQQRTFMRTLKCATHEELVGNLEKYHGESRKWWGINTHKELTELFVNMDNGAWTLIITKPSENLTCALSGGDHTGANFDGDSVVEDEM